MSPKGVLPMDSYRLAQYSVQIPCYVCDGENGKEGELCRHCAAPMALAHQAENQKLRPQMIGLLGASGAGKTVFLGMLTDMLSRPGQSLQLTARGAFSITLQQNTMGALRNCRFPDKTPSEPDRWNWVHCQVRSPNRRRPTELIVPDLAGEALVEEIDHPDTFPVIRSLLAKCAGVVILVDAARMAEGTKDQDFFGMKLLSYLSELDQRPKSGWRRKPIAFVLSKSDECELVFDNPEDFTREHSPGLWQHCQERFENYKMFASGVAGACAYRRPGSGNRIRIPLRVEPRGIVEPFVWLVQQLK